MEDKMEVNTEEVSLAVLEDDDDSVILKPTFIAVNEAYSSSDECIFSFSGDEDLPFPTVITFDRVVQSLYEAIMDPSTHCFRIQDEIHLLREIHIPSSVEVIRLNQVRDPIIEHIVFNDSEYSEAIRYSRTCGSRQYHGRYEFDTYDAWGDPTETRLVRVEALDTKYPESICLDIRDPSDVWVTKYKELYNLVDAYSKKKRKP